MRVKLLSADGRGDDDGQVEEKQHRKWRKRTTTLDESQLEGN